MRPPDPDDAGRIAAGVLRSIELAGYDWPVRNISKSNGSVYVTLPLQVRDCLDVKPGDWLVFGETPWPGVAAFLKVTAEQNEAIAADGRKEFRQLARKVQGKKGPLRFNIPKAVRKILSAEPGDSLIFGLTPVSGVISISAVKGGGDSAGSRRSG